MFEYVIHNRIRLGNRYIIAIITIIITIFIITNIIMIITVLI